MKYFLFITIYIFSFNSIAQDSARPWLGIGIEKGTKGVVVEKIIPETPAAKAELKNLDEILKIDGLSVTLPEELIQSVINKGIGHTVELEILRNGKIISKKIQLVGRPDMLEVAKKALVGKVAPDFTAKVLNTNQNESFKLSDKKGKLILIEFWATWCPACLSTFENVHKNAEKYKDKLEVYAISSESSQVIKKFLDKSMPKFITKKSDAVKYAISATKEQDIAAKYYVNSIPMFILIGTDGKVLDLGVGGGRVLDEILNLAQKNMN